MKNLPQNWVIDTQKEKDSPLMSKFMEWFKEKYGGVNDFNYFGVYNNRFGTWWDIQRETLITLEQWNAFYFPEWQPKQGEVILVSKDGQDFSQRAFASKYKGLYYCERLYSDIQLEGFKFAKPIPKESTLQPIMDQLKVEAEKLGLKVNITVE